MSRLSQNYNISYFNEQWYLDVKNHFENDTHFNQGLFNYDFVYNTIQIENKHGKYDNINEIRNYKLDLTEYCFERINFWKHIEKTNSINYNIGLTQKVLNEYYNRFNQKLDGINDTKIIVNELDNFCNDIKNEFEILKIEGLNSYILLNESELIASIDDSYVPVEISNDSNQESNYKIFIESFSEMFIEYFKEYFQKQIFYYDKYYGLPTSNVKKVTSSKSNLSDNEIYNMACDLKIFTNNTLTFNDLLKNSSISISGPEFLELLFTNQNKINGKGYSLQIDNEDKSILYKFLYSFKLNGFRFNGKAFINSININYLDSYSNRVTVSYDAFKQHKIDEKTNHTLPEIIELIKKRKR